MQVEPLYMQIVLVRGNKQTVTSWSRRTFSSEVRLDL